MVCTLRDIHEISKLHGQSSRVNSTHQNKETILYKLVFVNEWYSILMQIYINN
jgi:hypothetical protein